jgi:hypothetical protein
VVSLLPVLSIFNSSSSSFLYAAANFYYFVAAAAVAAAAVPVEEDLPPGRMMKTYGDAYDPLILALPRHDDV